MILKSVGEQSITALVTAVHKEWAGDSKNFQTQLIPRTSPVDDHASGGAAEATVHSLEGLTRTSEVALEESLGVSILSNSPILPWWCDIRVFSETGSLCDRAAEHLLKS